MLTDLTDDLGKINVLSSVRPAEPTSAPQRRSAFVSAIPGLDFAKISSRPRSSSAELVHTPISSGMPAPVLASPAPLEEDSF
jgi:hypothetical protein